VVTSQEDIDAVLGEMKKSAANDFSKIQGRFKTRLSLSSANVDEVIQERLLAKTPPSLKPLQDLYAAKGDILKDTARAINPVVMIGPEGPSGSLYPEFLAPYVDAVGWEHAKRSDNVRRFLQDLADEVVKACGRDVWNDALYEQIKNHVHMSAVMRVERPVVLTRLSLPIEAERLVAEGGAMVRITRPGYGPANSHPNEVALDDWPFDAHIENAGTLEDLEGAVSGMLYLLSVTSPLTLRD
jgi:hypothetical protein